LTLSLILALIGFPSTMMASGEAIVDRLYHGTEVQWEEKVSPVPAAAIAGPTEGSSGFVAVGDGQILQGALVSAVKDTGALTFWFKTDRTYRSGQAEPTINRKLIELADAFSISLLADPTSVTLIVEWGGPRQRMFERHIRVILPELPGPGWHHFALSWDGPKGALNVFLDGTPYYIPGEKVAPLEILEGRELRIHLGPIALAGITLRGSPLRPDELPAMVPGAYFGSLARLLGARPLGSVGSVEGKGKLLYENDFSAAASTKDWILEGPGVITHRDGWMEMRSARPAGPDGHFVLWCPQKFPADFLAEWEFEFLEEKGLCIVFFCATGKNGVDLFDRQLAPRAGLFEQYINGDVACYHISYFANTASEPRRVANLRKNPGFYLLSNGPVGVAKARLGEVHRAMLVKQGAHIQMAVDGQIIIDYQDDGLRAGPLYEGGRIGFREMQWTAARYRNFRVSALARDATVLR
jgi:hypothetical protein